METSSLGKATVYQYEVVCTKASIFWAKTAFENEESAIIGL
jgi:hypothetical protein